MTRDWCSLAPVAIRTKDQDQDQDQQGYVGHKYVQVVVLLRRCAPTVHPKRRGMFILLIASEMEEK